MRSYPGDFMYTGPAQPFPTIPRRCPRLARTQYPFSWRQGSRKMRFIGSQREPCSLQSVLQYRNYELLPCYTAGPCRAIHSRDRLFGLSFCLSGYPLHYLRLPRGKHCKSFLWLDISTRAGTCWPHVHGRHYALALDVWEGRSEVFQGGMT